MNTVHQSVSVNPPTLAALSSTRLLIAGDIMLDRYWFGEVSRISPEAPVPVVRVQRREERLDALGRKPVPHVGTVGVDVVDHTRTAVNTSA